MEPNATVLTEGRNMEPSNVVTDAGRFSETTHTSDEGDNYADVVAATSESEGITPSFPARVDPSPSSYYDMSGDKYLIVFNHYKYKKWRMKNFHQPSTRDGTNKDKKRIEATFWNRGFNVKTYDDCTHEEIKEHMSELCRKDHSSTSCVAVAVMTHGIDAHLSAADILYPLTDITGPLQAVPSLAKKPKLFFIQACRELHIRTRPELKNKDVPMSADCLYLYSSYQDYVSFRSPVYGAWMVQSLCKVIEENYNTLNLVQMVTLINNMVAQEDVLLVNRKVYKQIPVTDFKLRKYLML